MITAYYLLIKTLPVLRAQVNRLAKNYFPYLNQDNLLHFQKIRFNKTKHHTMLSFFGGPAVL